VPAGIIVFEMFSGELPYKGMAQEMIIFRVGRGKLPLDLSSLKRVKGMEKIQSLIEWARCSSPPSFPSSLPLATRWYRSSR
jgi:hypothetical protein